MAEKVEPSPSAAESLLLAAAIEHSAGDGWIVPSDTDLYAANDGATGTPLNAFDLASSSTTSFTVTIDTGEAFVGGKYCWIDTQTDVTLPSSSTTTVYLVMPPSSGDDVRIDHPGGADYPSNDTDRIPLWTFTTDGSGVTGSTNERQINSPLSIITDASTTETKIGTDLLSIAGQIASDGTVADGTSFLDIVAENNDVDVWHIGLNSGSYGFSMRYIGSGSGDANALNLYTDNQDGTGENQVWEILQSGNIDFKQTVTSDSRDVISEKKAWDGSEMILQTESGDTIRFTQE